MKRITPLESGIRKIKNALNQTNQSSAHNVSIKLPEQEYKAVMQEFLAEIAKPDNRKWVA